ncbi:hypothetical protein OSCI_2020004 [Kamptonema sp. PCC 6506]|nr:hypothetical protein OSCI_2020004 [Kamptonema sp. PCC 6506]
MLRAKKVTTDSIFERVDSGLMTNPLSINFLIVDSPLKSCA